MNKICVAAVLCFFVLRLLGQHDSVVHTLPVATIEAPLLRMEIAGSREAELDSQALHIFTTRPLSELLSARSGIYIKSYGLGSLATISLRGSSAGQTAVLWNGLPLQSPMLGQLDLALLPVAFTDRLRVQYGGQGAAWGSGAIGGAIHLDNQTDYQPGLDVNARIEAGSFDWFQQGVRVSFGNKKFQSTTRIFHQRAQNDFSYHPAPGLKPKRQSNARQRQWGLMQNLAWKPTPGEEWRLDLWWQQAERQIPPLLTQSRSEASQEDRIFRSLLQWKKVQELWVWKARVGWFKEDIHYRDPQILLEAPSSFQTLFAEAEAQRKINAQSRLSLGLQQQWTEALADEYSRSQNRQRWSAFAFYHLNWTSIDLHLGARQEWADGQAAFFSPSLALNWRAAPWLDLRAQLSRNYRLPTLNDLYWEPGGNPKLRPEHGWSQEFTLKVQPHPHWSYSLTGFNRLVQDWILWTPQGGPGIWSPANIIRVHSRGLENRLQLRLPLPQGYVQLQTGFDYIRSTNQKDIELPRLRAGQQLFYTPETRAFGALGAQLGPWRMSYEQQYTGPVETFSEPLPGFTTGSLNLQRSWSGPQWTAQLYLRLENLWDQDYFVIERRPMPGRYFRAGVQLSLAAGKEEKAGG